MPALASRPARPVRFCVFLEQRRRRKRPLVVAHDQVDRSIGRRRARAQRAHHSFDGRSRARRARLAAMRGSVALRVRDHVARSRSPPFASLDSIAVISQQVPCQDTRFIPFASRHFALRIENIRGRGQAQPARTCAHTSSRRHKIG